MDAKTLERVATLLNDAISSALYGPGGDPDASHNKAAAKAFVALKLLGLPVRNEIDITELLRSNNSASFDFLSAEGFGVRE